MKLTTEAVRTSRRASAVNSVWMAHNTLATITTDTRSTALTPIERQKLDVIVGALHELLFFHLQRDEDL